MYSTVQYSRVEYNVTHRVTHRVRLHLAISLLHLLCNQQRRNESTHRHPADKLNKSVVHRSGRSKERSTDMDKNKSNRHLRSSKTHQTLQTRGSYRTQEDRSPPDDDSDEKIVRIMTIDDEIKIRRDILEEKMILHQVTTTMMDRMMKVRQMKTPLIIQRSIYESNYRSLMALLLGNRGGHISKTVHHIIVGMTATN